MQHHGSRQALIASHPEAYVVYLADLGLTRDNFLEWFAEHSLPVVLPDVLEDTNLIWNAPKLVSFLIEKGVHPHSGRHVWNWKDGAIVPVVIADAPTGSDETYFHMLRMYSTSEGFKLGDWRNRFQRARPPLPNPSLPRPLPPSFLNVDDTLHPHRLPRLPPPLLSIPPQKRDPMQTMPDISKYRGTRTVHVQPQEPWAPWSRLLVENPVTKLVQGVASRVMEPR